MERPALFRRQMTDRPERNGVVELQRCDPLHPDIAAARNPDRRSRAGRPGHFFGLAPHWKHFALSRLRTKANCTSGQPWSL